MRLIARPAHLIALCLCSLAMPLMGCGAEADFPQAPDQVATEGPAASASAAIERPLKPLQPAECAGCHRDCTRLPVDDQFGCHVACIKTVQCTLTPDGQ